MNVPRMGVEGACGLGQFQVNGPGGNHSLSGENATYDFASDAIGVTRSHLAFLVLLGAQLHKYKTGSLLFE